MRDRWRRIVQAGYDAAGDQYLADRPSEGADMALVPELVSRLSAGCTVLDAGCGAGVPLTSHLVDHGLSVTGLDLSLSQLSLAARHVTRASLTQADLAALPFNEWSFDALTSFYAVIHVPRSDHQQVFQEFHRVLVPGGLALLCLGANDLPEDHDPYSWLGTPMYWSHFDATTNITMLSDVGFELVWHRLVPDPMDQAHHLFVLARRSP